MSASASERQRLNELAPFFRRALKPGQLGRWSGYDSAGIKMKSYLVKVSVVGGERPVEPNGEFPLGAIRFWRALANNRRPGSSFLEPLPKSDDEGVDVGRLEQALRLRLKKYLAEQFEARKLRNHVLGVHIQGYGSIDLLIVLDHALDEALSELFVGLITSGIEQIFGLVRNSLRAVDESEETTPEREERSLAPSERFLRRGAAFGAGALVLVALTFTALIKLLESLHATDAANLRTRAVEIDGRYSDLAQKQADLIANLGAELRQRSGQSEGSSQKMIETSLEFLRRVNEQKTQPRAGGNASDLIKLASTQYRLVAVEQLPPPQTTTTPTGPSVTATSTLKGAQLSR